MVARQHTGDGGFSLTELMVVLVLLGVVLAVSYGGLQAVYKGNEVSDRQAMFAREVGTPMQDIERVLTQAISIEAAGPYSVTVLTDRDQNDQYERHLLQVTSAGTLLRRTWDVNSSGVSTTVTFDNVWSDHNVNVRDGVAAFTFKDALGTPITNMTTARTEARSIDFELKVEYEGKSYGDVRTIYLRNR